MVRSLTHQGYRWYLEVAPSPVYLHKSKLFAVREDGDSDFAVVLQEMFELPGRFSPSCCRLSGS